MAATMKCYRAIAVRQVFWKLVAAWQQCYKLRELNSWTGFLAELLLPGQRLCED